MVELRLYTASMRVQIFHFLINIIKFINYKKKVYCFYIKIFNDWYFLKYIKIYIMYMYIYTFLFFLVLYL